MKPESTLQNTFESNRNLESSPKIIELPLEKLDSVIEKLRRQIADEYEYATVVQVFSGALSASAGKIFLVQYGEKTAGVGVVSLQNDTEGTLEALYVPKEYRDKDIGTSLTEARVRFLRNAGITKVHINVTSPGSRRIARRLQEQYGDQIDIRDHGDYFE